jgi:hypothetical protein
MEDNLNKQIEDNLNKKNGRQPQFIWTTRMTTSKKMEDNLTKINKKQPQKQIGRRPKKNGRRPQKKWKKT